jgi:DNA-binding MarR family transcriptional regulator
MRQTSIKSYQSIVDSIGSRQSQVLATLKKFGHLSNREISEKLGIPINQITPRTNELVQKGLVYHAGYQEDRLSKRTVMVWGLL